VIDLATIAELLDHLGVKHAPEQHFLNEPDKVDGRYVTLRDPPGVYYILGTDNDQLTSEVQLIFLEPPFAGDIGLPPELSEEVRAAITPRVDRYAGSIGYKVKKIEAIPSDKGSIPSAILEPRF
jgi:hypothetical protein